MKNRKKLTPIIIAAALIVVLSISVVIAYMFKKTAGISNIFFPASVTCQVEEDFENNAKTSVKVKNTGTIDAYIRLRVVINWQDSKGYTVARPMSDVYFVENYAGKNDFVYDGNNWIYDGEMTFYCKSPVKVGETTPELMKLGGGFTGFSLDPYVEEITNNGSTIVYTYYPVIEFVAEAIQAEYASDDPVYVWGLQIGSDGKLSMP